MTDRVRLGVVMDPIDPIKSAKDSTLGMLLAAQARGFELLYLEHPMSGCAMAPPGAHSPADRAHRPGTGSPWLQAPPKTLAELDVVLMRKDPPFDTEYIYSTYILERAEAAGVLVVNRPQGLRDMNEKVYTAWFPQCCAPTLITRDMADMGAFLREHGKVVVQAPGWHGRPLDLRARNGATRTPTSCSRRSPTTASATQSCSATCPRSH